MMKHLLSKAVFFAALLASTEACGGHGLTRRTGLSHSHHAGHRLFENRATEEDLQSQISGNGLQYPPAGIDPPTAVPQSWIDAYNSAKAAGKIPTNVARTTINNDTGLPEYPADQDPSVICSWTTQKCYDGDIWLSPEQRVGITFDDGPSPASPMLINYLKKEAQTATHFLIGSAIIWNTATMQKMAAMKPPLHFGCHTFTHTLQTTKTDMEIVGDLGWNMQLILDLTGKVPMYWRAPEGDVDSRVRAIAKHVFGLQHVSWSTGKDADDWCLREGHGTAKLDFCLQGPGKSFKSVSDTMVGWAKNTSSTDGWIALEHETTDQSFKAFRNYHKALLKNKWKPMAVPDLQGLPWYQNQFSRNDTAIPTKSILPTRPAIDIEDSSAAPGSSGAPNVSAFHNLGVTISQSSTSVSPQPSTSSAVQYIPSAMYPAMIAVIGAAVALL